MKSVLRGLLRAWDYTPVLILALLAVTLLDVIGVNQPRRWMASAPEWFKDVILLAVVARTFWFLSGARSTRRWQMYADAKREAARQRIEDWLHDKPQPRRVPRNFVKLK